ncbi:MAG: helix-turn-helix transcriptional regulator [Erysipelotrichaceae bacterium]|nr:helix-turn-helix transcriptional regulator [Erysipelotrichaceae bacterium]
MDDISVEKETEVNESNCTDQFIEALTCNPAVYTSVYDADGKLIRTNSSEHLYLRIFEHVGCIECMLEKSKVYHSPLVLSAHYGIMWCAVFEQKNSEVAKYYVIGPVYANELSEDLIAEMLRQHPVEQKYLPKFLAALRQIPAISTILFFQYAVMLHYFVNGIKISRSDLHFQQDTKTPYSEVTLGRYDRYHTYQAEQTLLQMVREGNMDYQDAMTQAGSLSSGLGIQAGDPVKRAILSASNFTALCTRAAIEGGISPDTAYTVGDSYLQNLIECKTISDVRIVNHAMYEDFISRVHKRRTNPSHSRQIQACVSYIESHPEDDLSLKKLASIVGYSEYHLSRKFKTETGENIRDYIRKIKVGRAKTLLLYTDATISEIAEQLSFSSTSHFSKTFSEITGELPLQYRKNNKA